ELRPGAHAAERARSGQPAHLRPGEPLEQRRPLEHRRLLLDDPPPATVTAAGRGERPRDPRLRHGCTNLPAQCPGGESAEDGRSGGPYASRMVPIDHLLTFAAAAFVLIVIPGPSVLFEISRSVALGRRAGLATVAGNALGELVQATAVAVGIGAIIQRSAPLFTAGTVVRVRLVITAPIR